jgi:hypothetical protein
VTEGHGVRVGPVIGIQVRRSTKDREGQTKRARQHPETVTPISYASLEIRDAPAMNFDCVGNNIIDTYGLCERRLVNVTGRRPRGRYGLQAARAHLMVCETYELCEFVT